MIKQPRSNMPRSQCEIFALSITNILIRIANSLRDRRAYFRAMRIAWNTHDVSLYEQPAPSCGAWRLIELEGGRHLDTMPAPRDLRCPTASRLYKQGRNQGWDRSNGCGPGSSG